MATNTANTKANEISPERKAYKADWMRRFRAKQRGESVVDDKTRSQLTQLERITMLERELRDLKSDVGLDITIDYTPEELRQIRIDDFEKQLNDLDNYSSIATLNAKIAKAATEFEAIRQGGDWFNQDGDRGEINRHRTRLRDMEAQAEHHEQRIATLSPGGKIRAEKEAGLAADRFKASEQLSSQDPREQRLGITLLNGCDKIQGELEVTLGRHKAELKKLRGWAG
jgi:hypothetical protein